jgi:hypothetical protein
MPILQIHYPKFDTAKLGLLELNLGGKEQETNIGVHALVDPIHTNSD